MNMSDDSHLTFKFVHLEDPERYPEWHRPSPMLESKIFAILDTYLQPSSEVSGTSSANQITELYPTDPTMQTPGTENSEAFMFLYHLWELLVMVAEQIPWRHPSQDKLIQLIKAIRDTPNPTSVYFDGSFHRGIKLELWADLPVMHGVLVDNMDSHAVIINDKSDNEKQSRVRNINFQSFAARLTLHGIHDLSRLGIYELRCPLEEDPDYYIEGYNDLGNHLDALILPAEVWISICGRVIYAFCKSNGEGAKRDDMPGGKYWIALNGKPGFSMGRWEFWKERLDWVAGREEASGETREVAKRMKATMIKLEEV